MKKIAKYFIVISLCLVAFHIEAQTTYQITSDTRLRSGPGTKFKSLGIIKAGEKVTVKEKISSSWFKIEYKGKIAFLSSKYIVAVIEAPTIKETSKVDEPPQVEREIAKSNSTNPYLIIALVILGLLFVILSSRVKKKQSIKEKKLSAVHDSITPKQIFKEISIIKEVQSIKKEPQPERTVNNKTDALEPELNRKAENNNKNVLISSMIGAVENRAVQQDNNVEGFDQSKKKNDTMDSPKEDSEKNVIISTDATVPNALKYNVEKDPAISNLTLNEFRSRIQELITALPNNKTREAITNFHRLDLSYIDLAKTRHELLALKEKGDIHNLFAFISPTGEIIWAKMEHHTILDLMIGQPLLRVDYYHNIIQLIRLIIRLNDNTIGKSSDVQKENNKEGIKSDPMERNKIIGFTILPNNGGIIDITEEKYSLPQYPQDNSTFNRPLNSEYNFIAQYWGLGTKYKSKLRLNDNEVKILDSLIDTDNKFNSIEFISIEIIRLFFDTVNHLKDEFVKMGTSMEQQTSLVAELELTQRYKLWKDSNSYLSQLSVFANSINQVIYKICENSLREYFFIGRKTDLKYYIYSNDALAEFNTRFGTIIQVYIPQRLVEIKPCDDITEASLNEYNKSRWKNKLDLLKIDCEMQEHASFYKNVIELGNHNKNNPAVENIFFDASKFISKFNKEIALKLYVYYIYYDLQSATFDNKKFAKAIQKSLFSNDQQLREFEAIINKLIEERKVDSAVDAVSTIYAPRRKKIQLDSTKIKEVLEKDSDTVELLNEYLKEENEETVTPINIENQEEVNLFINYSNLKETTSIYKESNRLSEIQQETLDLFSKRGFTLSINEFDTFVKSNGVFKNSLIESINDIYFGLLDDILIEEDAEQINLNEAYYNKIIN